MKTLACLVALSALIAPAAADELDEPWEIHGFVVDEQGEPVEDFEAATFWLSNGNWWDETGELLKEAAEGKLWKNEGVLAVNPRKLAKRSPGGKFSLTIDGFSHQCVFVTDAEHRRGEAILVHKAFRAVEVIVMLRPLVRVHGKIYCPDARRTPDWTGVRVHLPGDEANGFMLCGSFKGEFSFLLPPGKYDFGVRSRSPDASMPRPTNPPADMPKYIRGIRVDVPAGETELDLGELHVEIGR